MTIWQNEPMFVIFRCNRFLASLRPLKTFQNCSCQMVMLLQLCWCYNSLSLIFSNSFTCWKMSRPLRCVSFNFSSSFWLMRNSRLVFKKPSQKFFLLASVARASFRVMKKKGVKRATLVLQTCTSSRRVVGTVDAGRAVRSAWWEGKRLGDGTPRSAVFVCALLLQEGATRACAVAGVQAEPNAVAELFRAEGEVHDITFYSLPAIQVWRLLLQPPAWDACTVFADLQTSQCELRNKCVSLCVIFRSSCRLVTWQNLQSQGGSCAAEKLPHSIQLFEKVKEKKWSLRSTWIYKCYFKVEIDQIIHVLKTQYCKFISSTFREYHLPPTNFSETTHQITSVQLFTGNYGALSDGA